MARVKPFRGIRYNNAKFHDQMCRLVAPPYDVIDDEQLSALYESHINNIVRMDLNRPGAQDESDNNKYTRARRYLMDWIAEGDLIVDTEPSLYVHVQTFRDGRGVEMTRRGFIGLAGLEPYEARVILPHERTLSGPRADRLALMKATECNLSQIFMLYDDPACHIDALLEQARGADEPVVDITTPDQIRHQLWRVTDEVALAKVSQALEDQQLLIADGHHRYETALAYQAFRRACVECEPPKGPAPYDFVMTFFVNMHDAGLLVLPTHRLVHGLDALELGALTARLHAHPDFEVEALAIAPDDGDALTQTLARAGETKPSFVLLAPGLERPLLVSFVGAVASERFDAETPAEVRQLDVAILHEVLLDRMLGIDKAAQEAGTHLAYYKRLPEVMAAAREPRAQLVVLMNATPVAQVASVCRSGGKMPQKSTYFYPKILSGLVINPL